MKKRVALFTVTLIISLIISIALLCPAGTYYEYNPDGTPEYNLSSIDADKVNSAEYTPDGSFTITGEDPYIIFNDLNLDVDFAVITFSEDFTKQEKIQLYYNVGTGISEANSMLDLVEIGENFAYFHLVDEVYNAFRLDIDSDCKITSIDLYEKVPEMTEVKVNVSPLRYVLAVVISVLVTVFMFFLDKRFLVAEKIYNCIYNNRKNILITFIGIALALVCAGVIELIFSAVIKSALNLYRFVFFACVLLVICVFIGYRKVLGEKPEKAFFALILIIGTMLIATAPIGHTAYDIDHHYTWALGASYVGEANISGADYTVKVINFWSGLNPKDSSNVVEKMNNLDNVLFFQQDLDTTIAHRLSGVIIAVARLFGCSFFVKYKLGLFGNLIIYAVFCALSMKKLKSGKMIVAAISLFPSNLFLATNYSYDYWLTALSIFGIAYFISELQQPDKPLKIWDSIILCGALGLSCLPKLVYMPLLILPFFMAKNNFTKSDRKRHHLICVLAIVAVFIMFAVKSIVTTAGTGDLRGGLDVNPTEQLKYILSEPFTYAKLLLEFMRSWLLDIQTYYYEIFLLGEYHMGGKPEIFFIILVFATLTDKSDCDAYKNRNILRVLNILLYVGIFALVCTSMYIAYVPVYSDYIAGVQHRYITPLLFPLLVVIAPTRIFRIDTKGRAIYNGAILGTLSVLLVYYFAKLYMPMVAQVIDLPFGL